MVEPPSDPRQIADAAGIKHDWRAELIDKIARAANIKEE